MLKVPYAIQFSESHRNTNNHVKHRFAQVKGD